MAAKPYVGVTGPVNARETREICDKFSEAGYSMSGQHIPMLGFLVSQKTLMGESTKNRRYPSFNSLKDLLNETNGRVLTMVHYNSKEMDTLSNQVENIFEGVYGEGLCRALQLNIVWPDIGQVTKIKRQYPEMQIVFQASHNAMDGKTASQIANGIAAYGDSLDYVLIDPSGGRGLPFDVDSSYAVYSEIRDKCPDLTIGFAGGFTGENVFQVGWEIVGRTGREDFCLDAEGGLRNKITPAYGDDLLDINKVGKYLHASSMIFD